MRLEDITVILPTRNEERNIQTFLQSIPEAARLVVVDASEDNTPDLVVQVRPKRSVVLRQPGSISQARQIGADYALTPWLLFTDADVTFAPDYFERLRNHRYGDVVYGSKQSQDKFVRFYRWFSYGQKLSHWMGAPAATGSNFVIRREALKLAGGFDLQLVCNEDSELIWRVKRAGYRVFFDRHLVVYAHDHRRLHRGLWRKSLHSIARCILLYFNAMPSRWRASDWGYWSQNEKREMSTPNRCS